MRGRSLASSSADVGRGVDPPEATDSISADWDVVVGTDSTGSLASSGMTSSGLTSSGLTSSGMTSSGMTSWGMTSLGMTSWGISSPNCSPLGEGLTICRRTKTGSAASSGTHPTQCECVYRGQRLAGCEARAHT